MKPEDRPSRTFPHPEIHSSSLRNGLKVYAVPRAELPLVGIHLILPCGAEMDPPGRGGLADLSAEMLTLGTQKRSAPQLAAEIDGLGASLSAHAGWNGTSLFISGLKEDLDRLLGLILEIYTQPAFSADEFAQLKQRRTAQLVQQKDESQIIADEGFQEILFQGTAYAHPVYGTLDSLPGLAAEEVRQFHRESFLPPGSFLVLAGDLQPEKCFRWVEENLPSSPGWKSRAAEFSPPYPSEIKTRMIDRPDLTQSQIRLGHIGIPHAHPEYLPFEVANYILGGGGFSSRLMRRVRSELGYTYGINSSLEPRKFAGPFAVSTFAPTEVTFPCVREIFSVIHSFLDRGVTGPEREEAVNFLTGSYPRKFETLSQVAQRIIQAELHGLGIEYLSAYPERIAGVSPESISRSAGEIIHPRAMLVVVVGRAEIFRRQFESLGPVEIVQ
jgi:zinc protease